MAADPFRTCLVMAGACLLLNGCGKTHDPAAEAVQLQKVFASDARSNQFVAVALSAMQTNNYPAAVLALENARTIPGTTPDQLIALQRTKEAMIADLVRRAEGGDARAREDLVVLERSRSQ